MEGPYTTNDIKDATNNKHDQLHKSLHESKKKNYFLVEDIYRVLCVG